MKATTDSGAWWTSTTKFEIPGVMSINGSALATCPDIVEAAVERKWEFVGHGFTQRTTQTVPNEGKTCATPPKLSPGVTGKDRVAGSAPGTETRDTPDILREEGYDYVADWRLDDDQPVLAQHCSQPIVSLSYTLECNNVAMMLIQHHRASDSMTARSTSSNRFTPMPKAPHP